MPEELSTIQNPDSSEYVSQLLDLMIQDLAGTGVPTEVTRQPLPNKKTSLVVEIAIGLGISATWDLIKFAVDALKPSRRASPGDELTLDGKRYALTEIDKEGPDAPDDETGQDIG